MIITQKTSNVCNATFTLNNSVIENVEEFDYLGIEITNNLSDNITIKHQYRNICARSNTLIRKFNNCSESVKINLFKSYCSSIYGVALWATYHVRIFNRMRVCFNNSFRFLIGLPTFCSASHMFLSRGLPTFQEIIRKRQFSLMSRINLSVNKIIMKTSSASFFKSPIWTNWRNSLYV